MVLCPCGGTGRRLWLLLALAVNSSSSPPPAPPQSRAATLWVESGGPFHDPAHAADAQSRGGAKYLGSLRFSVRPAPGGGPDTVAEVGVYSDSVADQVAASLFRTYSVPFDHSYVSVHNAIHAVVRGEEGPEDFSKSKAQDKGFTGKHPYLERADEAKNLFMKVKVPLAGRGGGGGGVLDVSVMEGELPEAAVKRAVEGMGGGGGNLDVRGAVDLVEEAMVEQLVVEEREIESRLGRGPPWQEDQPLDTPLRPIPAPGKDPSALWDEGSAQREIFVRQNPTDCSRRRALVFSFDRSIVGLAVNVHYMTLLMNYCWIHNRTMIMADPDHWNYAGSKCTRGWACYFEPITPCLESDVWQPYSLDVRDDVKVDYRGYMYSVDTSSGEVLRFSNVDGPWLELLNRDEYKHFIPKEYAHRGVLWWRSQLTRYLFRPKPFVLEYTNERQAAMRWGAGHGGGGLVVGMHVRHGDKSWDVPHQGSYFGGLGRYVEKGRGLLSSDATLEGKEFKYFISTDDASVLTKASEEGGLDRQVMWDDREARYNGTHVYAPPGVSDKRWPGFPGDDVNVDTFRYAMDSIKSILLLVRSDVFVGSSTSCFSRLVYQLRAVTDKGSLSMGGEWTVDSDPRYPDSPGWFADP